MTVVLPLVPVTAQKRLGSTRQESSSSPITGTPSSRAATIGGAVAGTPGLLTRQRTSRTLSIASPSRMISTPAPSSPAAPSGEPESTPITFSPRLASVSTAACPERASPTTMNGPSGRGGRTFSEGMETSFAPPSPATFLT